MNIRLSFDLPLAAVVLLALSCAGPSAEEVSSIPNPPVKPAVEGKFLGNAKPARIKFVSVQEIEPFDDKNALKLVFSEQDHTKDQNTSFITSSGKFGNAITVSIHYDGSVFSSSIGHNGLRLTPFSSVGELEITDFKLEGGTISGHLTSKGVRDWVKETWEVDLKFSAPLPESLRDRSSTGANNR